MSLRLKLLIAVILVAVAGLVVTDVVTYTSLQSFLMDRVDQQLEAARFPIARELSKGRARPFSGPHDPGSSQVPPGTFAEWRDSSGSVVGSSLVYAYGGPTQPEPVIPSTLPRPGASDAEPDLFTTGAAGGASLRYRVRVDPLAEDAGVLIVAIPLTDVDQTLGRLRIIEGVVSGVVVLGLGLVLWWLVRRGLRPLEEMGVAAGAIAAGDLTRRVEPTDGRTEIGRLGLALNEMLAQIEAAFEERRASEARLRRFVADASHELRTPLTSIRGYAELFRRGADTRPEDLAKSMRRIEAEAARLGVLVDDLLLLARLDQGRQLEREAVDLARVAEDAADSARAIDANRRLTLNVDGPALVVGDGGRLRQVVDNLLDNARVHTPAGTPVQVTVDREGQDVVLSVADEGPGVLPDVATRVFERFYRGDPARSRRTGGVGLGLSIVSAIVEAHGGKVRCESSNGAGATFEVRLPALSSGTSTSDETDPDGPGREADLSKA